jgi:hypothetical protein
MKKIVPTISVILILLLTINFAHADGEINLTNFPTYLADQLSISVFAGGILAGIIFMMLVLFPCLLLTRGKNLILLIIVGISSMCFNVAVGYFPVWTLIIVALIIALMFAGEMRTLITGRGSG